MSEQPRKFSALALTRTFLTTLCGREFSAPERKAFLKALALLNANENHPSLRVNELSGDLDGVWSASASHSLRMTFIRGGDGRKILLACTRHYAGAP